jgi:hypothetical protein
MLRVGSGGGEADGRVWSREAATEGRDTFGGGEPLTIWSRPVEVDMESDGGLERSLKERWYHEM